MSKHSGSVSAPKLTIEQDDQQATDAVVDEATAEQAASGEASGGASTKRGRRKKRLDHEDLEEAVGFIQGLGAAAWAYARSHPYTVGYGFTGFVLAVLVLTIGLWSTIIIAVFVVVGAMIGQIRDGDNGIVNFFSGLIGSRRS